MPLKDLKKFVVHDQKWRILEDYTMHMYLFHTEKNMEVLNYNPERLLEDVWL
jgi:hypothetical protein